MAFLQTSGIDFVLDGQKWVPFGGSTYDISTGDTSNPDAKIAAALSMGMNMIRIVNYFGAELGYKESQWVRVDYILNQCRLNNLKVLFDLSDYTAVLANNGHDFEDQPVEDYIDLWNTFLIWVFNRVNTINGLTYKNDDVIGIVSISGEVGYATGRTDGTFLHDWFAGTSAHIKTIDTNHVIHAGGQIPEIAVSTDYISDGRQQDMLSIPTIDCISTHPYYTQQNMTDLFPLLSAYAIEKQKPWFIEEFGYNQSVSAIRPDRSRAQLLKFVFDIGFRYNSAAFLFWNIDDGYYNELTNSGGGYGINANTPFCFNMVKRYSRYRTYSRRIPVSAAEYGGI
jgi:endo-1,4-beta-mannosidase